MKQIEIKEKDVVQHLRTLDLKNVLGIFTKENVEEELYEFLKKTVVSFSGLHIIMKKFKERIVNQNNFMIIYLSDNCRYVYDTCCEIDDDGVSIYGVRYFWKKDRLEIPKPPIPKEYKGFNLNNYVHEVEQVLNNSKELEKYKFNFLNKESSFDNKNFSGEIKLDFRPKNRPKRPKVESNVFCYNSEKNIFNLELKNVFEDQNELVVETIKDLIDKLNNE